MRRNGDAGFAGGLRAALSGFSLEATTRDVQAIAEVASSLPEGTKVSMTFLPNESVADRLQLAVAIKEWGLDPMPHLSARRLSSREALSDYLDRLNAEAGVRSVFTIAGDVAKSVGPFDDALALIASADFRSHGVTTVAIAGYPEGHPAIPRDNLWAAMHAKRAEIRKQGMRSEIVTQFAFSAEPILVWLAELRERGVDDLVRIGIPGPANARTMLRYAAICGVEASSSVLAKYGFSLARLLKPSGPDGLLRDLVVGLSPAIHGDTAIHIFPFGGLGATADWVRSATAN